MWIVVVASLAASVNAIADSSCTFNGAYTAQATACQNQYSDATCNMYFPSSLVKSGGTDERPAGCYLANGTPNKDIIAFATKNCAKTCGFCCLAPEYNCKNKPRSQSRMDCSIVTKAQCNSAAWRNTLAQDCPAACGLCEAGGCVDSTPHCATNTEVCRTMPLDWVMRECRRTCGHCNTPLAPSAPAPYVAPPAPMAPATAPCKDNSRYCHHWGKQFCTGNHYSYEQKLSQCAKYCGFC